MWDSFVKPNIVLGEVGLFLLIVPMSNCGLKDCHELPDSLKYDKHEKKLPKSDVMMSDDVGWCKLDQCLYNRI